MNKGNSFTFASLLKNKWVLGGAAIIGALLLIMSFFTGGDEGGRAVSETAYTSEEYIKDTEKKLSDIVSRITGSDKVNVMITLETAVENIYADSTKTDTAVAENTGNTGNGKTEQSERKEKEYIIVKDSNGDERALTVTQVMPTIRGVVIVCKSGGDPYIVQSVKDAVVTVLNINAKKVCVVERQS